VTRTQLEHIIRAAATIADDDEIIVIGSQAVLGQFPDAPPELLVSNEADVYPKNRPERADLIDGSIGELSPFHDTFGYYAQGVGEGTAKLPEGWRDRLVPLKTPATRGATGLCLELPFVAGRGPRLVVRAGRAPLRRFLTRCALFSRRGRFSPSCGNDGRRQEASGRERR
jgi:hypothetical protein